jgi:hypothetical protein
MSSIAEVFPHDDPVARFVVAMSMARNDVRHALANAGRAGEQDDPEFTYWVRIATGHYFEAAYALDHWRQIPEIRAFLDGLPQDGRDALRDATSAIQKIGSAALEYSRNRTFHYPYPTSRYPSDEEFSDTLKALGKQEATLTVESPRHGWFRLQFADRVAEGLAVRKHDPAKIKQQFALARDGAIGFVNFATRAWEQYARTRGLELGLPVPPGDDRSDTVGGGSDTAGGV